MHTNGGCAVAVVTDEERAMVRLLEVQREVGTPPPAKNPDDQWWWEAFGGLLVAATVAHAVGAQAAADGDGHRLPMDLAFALHQLGEACLAAAEQLSAHDVVSDTGRRPAGGYEAPGRSGA